MGQRQGSRGVLSLKSMLHRLLPEQVKRSWWYLTDRQWRATYCDSRRKISSLQNAQRRAFAQLCQQTNDTVVAGPFRGLRYVVSINRGTFTQKLLGTYEKELWSVIEEIVSRAYPLVVDVGAAEGFYVNGLAMRLPQARIVAFEAQTECHSRLLDIARSNNLAERIEVHGICQPGDLRNTLASDVPKLLICDVEGAEEELLDPAKVPALRECDILVEVHDCIRPGIGVELKRRFGPTHSIRIIASTPRTLDDLPVGIELEPELALAAMDECRGVDMEWFWMTNR